jgi:signal transduction histidine kinase
VNSLQKNRIFFSFRGISALTFPIVLFLYSLTINSQSSSWKIINSPINKNINQLFLFSDSSGVALGSKLLLLKGNTWNEINTIPSRISKLSVAEDGTLFINNSNKYQESTLYYREGKDWKNLDHPLVSAVSDLYFRDKSNGIIAGLGEICMLNQNKWTFLPAPTINYIKKILIDKQNSIYVLTIDKGLFRLDDTWTPIENSNQIKSMVIYDNDVYVMTDKAIGKILKNKIITIAENNELEYANAFDIINKKEFIVVGQKGLILKYMNGLWQREAILTNNHLYTIKMINNNSGWCAGEDGVILHYSALDSYPDFVNEWKGFESRLHRGYAKMIDDEYGVVISDFNNDFKPDIFACGLFETDHLYINKGNFIFQDEADKWGLGSKDEQSNNLYNLGAISGDFDNDGFRDLYLCTLNGFNKIYKNIDGKRFEDYAQIWGGLGRRNDRTNSSILGDVDNDGDIDLFILNEYSSNRLYINNGAGVLKEKTNIAGLTTDGGGMSGTFGDVDNDGDIDLFVANWSTTNVLYLNRWMETGQIYFEDVSSSAGVQGEFFTKSNGVVFNDVDTDGDLDLFVSNRKFSNHLYMNDGKGKFVDKTSEKLGIDTLKTNGIIIEDLDGDGYKDIYLSNVGANTFYKGQANGQYIENTSQFGLDLGGYSTGLALGDFDNDMDYDIYAANYLDESSMWFMNKLQDKNFVNVRLDGYINNRNAIGTKIHTYSAGFLNQADKLIDYRELTAGQGYASMNELLSLIPVKGDGKVDIKIVYPSGIEIVKTNINAGTEILVSDVTGWKQIYFRINNRMANTFLDPHELINFLKLLFVLTTIIFFLFLFRKKYDLNFRIIMFWGMSTLILYCFQVAYLEYESIILSTILPIGVTVGLFILILQYYERKWVKLSAENQQKNIKNKISRDLHDDLAATISTIGIYLVLIRKRLGKEDTQLQNLLSQTDLLIQNAGSRVSDLVWSLKPKRETIDSLFSRIQKNYGEMLQEKEIRFIIEIDERYEKQILTSIQKQNIYLIFKEALNNILKYAQATEIRMGFQKSKKKLILFISDDGIGFDLDNAHNKGHGLSNMKNRAVEIGANFNIESKKGKGTICTLKLSANKKAAD